MCMDGCVHVYETNLLSVLVTTLQCTNTHCCQWGGKCLLVHVLVERDRDDQDTTESSPPKHGKLQVCEQFRWQHVGNGWIRNDPVKELLDNSVVIEQTVKETIHSFLVRATMLEM